MEVEDEPDAETNEEFIDAYITDHNNGTTRKQNRPNKVVAQEALGEHHVPSLASCTFILLPGLKKPFSFVKGTRRTKLLDVSAIGTV